MTAWYNILPCDERCKGPDAFVTDESHILWHIYLMIDRQEMTAWYNILPCDERCKDPNAFVTDEAHILWHIYLMIDRLVK